ncbi:hypothetical protein [Enteractinococcus helveticum]|uniref:Uncharacterized protein n=1 Tax=Enteractinococcus helveticum TaxID=1837282 RepID=A0A1B7LZR6_9MICC|nr:hypothetical protein [Enteractinococcus helveticum]OAV61158.1 hypothetical protein A6F49_09280 [Enteractinococcus helveticum]
MPETYLIQDYLPPKARKIIYLAYALAGLAIGATQVGMAAAGMALPVWLTVTLAVYAFLGGAVGLTATKHTPTQRDTGPADPTTQPPQVVLP